MRGRFRAALPTRATDRRPVILTSAASSARLERPRQLGSADSAKGPRLRLRVRGVLDLLRSPFHVSGPVTVRPSAVNRTAGLPLSLQGTAPGGIGFVYVWRKSRAMIWPF